jgi:hypothetical protein
MECFCVIEARANGDSVIDGSILVEETRGENARDFDQYRATGEVEGLTCSDRDLAQ